MKSKQPADFKWRYFQGEIILQCVRWYCKYRISYRDLKEMITCGFQSMKTAYASIKGMEIMRMFRKGQFNCWMYGNRNEVTFINQLFHVTDGRP